jgi:hypothetical protein
MKKFILKLTYFALILSIPVLFSYLYFDPFKVIWHYDDYSYPYVIPNRDFISTRTFLNNYEDNKYNSFVFGSSRTIAFKPNSWKHYLSKADNVFMFDASSESIYGIYTKIKYLNSKDIEIKNALILLCRDVTFNNSENHSGHLFIKHPEISGENKLMFHLTFFKAYLNTKFLFNFLSYKITGHFKPYMAGFIENRVITYNNRTNEINIVDQEVEINENPTEYYAKRKDIFYIRSGKKQDSVRKINEKQVVMLNEIKQILDRKNTNYKVILSPLYDQLKFHNTDMLILENIFGNKLYDFTGKNKFTENPLNYYETSHFRPNVGDSILQTIYH